jgi:hypothetical protein
MILTCMHVIQVVILTKLEIMLPLYWNTSTRHLLLHTVEFIERFGNIWAFSMLGVERIHVMIKKLGRSKRNIMASIQKNNDRLAQSQLQWRYDSEHKWSFDARQSSLQMKKDIPERKHDVLPKGGLNKRTLQSDTFFKYFQDAWTVVSPEFREFRDQYYVTYLRRCKRKKIQPVPFHMWREDKNTAEQKRYKTHIYLALVMFYLSL